MFTTDTKKEKVLHIHLEQGNYPKDVLLKINGETVAAFLCDYDGTEHLLGVYREQLGKLGIKLKVE